MPRPLPSSIPHLLATSMLGASFGAWAQASDAPPAAAPPEHSLSFNVGLASDYRYVPIKIKKIEKNGMVIEQVATRLIAE